VTSLHELVFGSDIFFSHKSSNDMLLDAVIFFVEFNGTSHVSVM
jgi:hypothetical protein